jgi:hypothetical protein
MENIGVIFPAIMMVGLGIAIGMYISSQIKCHISRRINNKELIKNLDEKEKTK